MPDNKENIKRQMEDALKSGHGPKVARYALACLSGIPAIGGVFSASSGAWAEAEQAKMNKIFEQWLKLQEEELKEIGQTLFEVMIRIDHEDEKVNDRIQSEGYLSLIKKCFRDWSAAESEDKRRLIRNLLSNAASCEMVTDDVLRLFIEWIGQYSELHFKVIACLYNKEGLTRLEMWQNLQGADVREDSAEADLYKLVVQDLSVGHIIRQRRDVDAYGRYLKAGRKSRKSTSSYMQSAFDDEKEYVLTSLGRQFVHYTMNEIVPKLEAPKS